MSHHHQDLITLFNGLFRETEGTILVRGGDEPVYLPRDETFPWDRVIFAHGYYASALHEISHWCIAGPQRRRRQDFGYWYQPDGRSAEQQRLFEKVEVKPQALEWIFSEAAGFRFNLSLDNLSGTGSEQEHGFAERVCEQARIYMDRGMPSRAETFRGALLTFYGREGRLSSALFHVGRLALGGSREPEAAPKGAAAENVGFRTAARGRVPD